MWHSKALHIAGLFLPETCPLTVHVVNSFKKHHLGPKLELLKKIDEKTTNLNSFSSIPNEEIVENRFKTRILKNDGVTAVWLNNHEQKPDKPKEPPSSYQPITQISTRLERQIKKLNDSKQTKPEDVVSVERG